MEKYIPDIYQKNIYSIDYDKLYKNGIRCLLFDLDNTLVPLNIKEPNTKLVDFINDLKTKGFKIIIFSLNTKKRILPFKEGLGVDCCSVVGKKIDKKISYILKLYNYKEDEVALIGDQMLINITNGNKVGITTILINPISTKEHFFNKMNRIKEKKIMEKLRKNNLFVKGRYYE